MPHSQIRVALHVAKGTFPTRQGPSAQAVVANRRGFPIGGCRLRRDKSSCALIGCFETKGNVAEMQVARQDRHTEGWSSSRFVMSVYHSRRHRAHR